MRKLTYSMTVSLDGYIAGPDGAIDWLVPDEELFRFYHQQVQEIGVHPAISELRWASGTVPNIRWSRIST